MAVRADHPYTARILVVNGLLVLLVHERLHLVTGGAEAERVRRLDGLQEAAGQDDAEHQRQHSARGDAQQVPAGGPAPQSRPDSLILARAVPGVVLLDHDSLRLFRLAASRARPGAIAAGADRSRATDRYSKRSGPWLA